MEFFQVFIGGMFSLLAACTVIYVAFRAHGIGNDVSEMKEILKDIRRNGSNNTTVPIASLAESVAGSNSQREPGEWPSVMDPAYETAELASGLKPSESLRSPETTQPGSW